MRSVFHFTLGVTALAQVVVFVPAASGQAAEPHACSLFQASDVIRISGRKDILGRGLRPSKPGETAAGTTECDYQDLSIVLTRGMTREWFARNRQMTESARDRWKVQSVSGLGDEAYYMWDPRPGSNRSVGLVFRTGDKQMAIGNLASADSIEATKSMLTQVAKLALPKLR